MNIITTVSQCSPRPRASFSTSTFIFWGVSPPGAYTFVDAMAGQNNYCYCQFSYKLIITFVCRHKKDSFAGQSFTYEMLICSSLQTYRWIGVCQQPVADVHVYTKKRCLFVSVTFTSCYCVALLNKLLEFGCFLLKSLSVKPVFDHLSKYK